MPAHRALHSSTFWLNVSTFTSHVGYVGWFQCSKRHRLSWEVDEWESLPAHIWYRYPLITRRSFDTCGCVSWP